MATSETPARRLGRAVTERRQQLGLSVRAIAMTAGVDRNTWSSLEAGSRRTQDRHYAAIEEALDWPAGEIERILDGRKASRPAPTDAEILSMDWLRMGRYAQYLLETEGREASDDWVVYAATMRKKAHQTLLSDHT